METKQIPSTVVGLVLLVAVTLPSWGQQPCLRWFEVSSAGSPGPRYGHAMAYDSDRRVTVLFGGTTVPNGVMADNETWEYNGRDWKIIPITGSKPGPRAWHDMAYDAARREIVLFGGKIPIANRDTWVFRSDGVTGTWTRRFPVDAPPSFLWDYCDGGLWGHKMVYDSAQRLVLLQGGATACDGHSSDYTHVYEDTWQWNGLNWDRHWNLAVGSRDDAALAFDSIRKVTVLFGGEGCSGSDDNPCKEHDLKAGTWEYSSGTWTQVPGSTPSLRVAHTMAFDTLRNKIVMFGGGPLSGDSTSDDTYEYTAGVGWTSLLDSGPPPRGYHGMVYDSHRGVMVVYGGINILTLGQVFDDTWELDVCTRPPEVVRWVDFAYTGAEELGTFAAPFNTLAEGITAIPAGGLLKIKAGTTSARPTIAKAMTLSSYGGPVIIGQ